MDERATAPSGIAQLRKSSDQSRETQDGMNLDEFIFSDNVSMSADMSPSPDLRERQPPMVANAMASAIPIKMRNETAASFAPQSVPALQHRTHTRDEFGYVQRHIRKTSIDERRVCIFPALPNTLFFALF